MLTSHCAMVTVSTLIVYWFWYMACSNAQIFEYKTIFFGQKFVTVLGSVAVVLPSSTNWGINNKDYLLSTGNIVTLFPWSNSRLKWPPCCYWVVPAPSPREFCKKLWQSWQGEMLGQIRCQMIILINWIHFPTANCQHGSDAARMRLKWCDTPFHNLQHLCLKSNCNGLKKVDNVSDCFWWGEYLREPERYFIFSRIRPDLCQLKSVGNVIVPKMSSDE